MRPTGDSDWLEGDPDEMASTERAPNLGVWRCDGDQFEPTQFATLIEATGEKPATPEAQVYGGGALLAQSAEDVAQWVFPPAGLARVEREMQAAIDRDTDTSLAILLADDFVRAVAS